jgi:hypothetical protein
MPIAMAKRRVKKLSRFFSKVQAMTWSQIREDYGLGLSNHCAPPAAGFSRPANLSPDIKLCELRVNGTARVHGFQDDSTFFLIWLDRSHTVFTDGK